MPIRCICKADEERHEPEPTPFYLYASDEGMEAAVCPSCGYTLIFTEEEQAA